MGNMHFLGGTCANSTWRDEWIEKNNGKLSFQSVDVWDESAQAKKTKKKTCGIHLWIYSVATRYIL